MTADPTLTPQNDLSAPSRPAERRRALGVTRARQTVEQLTSGRTEARAARAYAEEWYQALRAWATVTGHAVVSGGGPPRSGGRMMRPVVGNWPSTPGGSFSYTMIETPAGRVGQVGIADLCNRNPLLELIRAGRALSSLIHDNGRGWNGERAPLYAQAVLTLATRLGDAQAETYLKYLSFVED